MVRRKINPDRWQLAQEVASAMHEQDQEAAERSERDREQQAFIALDLIRDRPTDTRALRSQHVNALAESISILGLLEPLVVDARHRLLAGGHRLAAIRHLKQQNPIVYKQSFPDDQIPVRILPFDAEKDPDRALQCEVAENEHRRDYTPNEVRALADRLRSHGYHDQRGRPQKGEKALGPALEVIIGKHRRTVQRYLQTGEPEKIRQNVAFTQEQILLRQLKKAAEGWQKLHQLTSVGELLDKSRLEATTTKQTALAKKLPSLLKLVNELLQETTSAE